MRTSIITAVIILVCCFTARFARAAEGPMFARPYSLEILDEGGNSLPTFEQAGRTYVLGTLGQRYLVRIANQTGQRIEVVASVDGRDVIDGQPARWDKRGYVVDPYGRVTIDGYRLSQESVAAFRFSSVPRSYSAQMGSARDVGVIGVAVFVERPQIIPMPHPFRRAPSPEAREPSADNGAREGVEGGVPGGEVGGKVDSAPESKDSQELPPNESRSSDLSARGALPRQRPGLGTEFAEEHLSHVIPVHFVRASYTPATILSLHYNDRAGLLAVGIDVDGRGWYGGQDTALRETAEPFRRNASFSQPPPVWRR